ncbi:Hypothetical predicted protein [Paramuricea clavata]|uniref:Uncharacterized protein n=1 Tax=Paramuricea clavata TaxID=317549 RepID=A0A6S7H4F4_PARCT|nr:Hypothetical predicted protein [Paramuricea clavata]
MTDDPIITPGMEEFLLQTESGLSAGPITAGLVAPQGILLLTSNNNVFIRADGRIIVLKYHKMPFSVDDRKKLKAGIGSIAETHTIMKWLNPLTTVPVNQQYCPAIGIRSSVLDAFINLKSKDVSATLRQISDRKKMTRNAKDKFNLGWAIIEKDQDEGHEQQTADTIT